MKAGTNSTTPSISKALTANEICSIIKECKSAGVRQFSYGELSINLADVPLEQISIPEQPIPSPMQEEPDLRRRARSKKEEFQTALEEARLADPTLYEELIAIEDMNEITDD